MIFLMLFPLEDCPRKYLKIFSTDFTFRQQKILLTTRIVRLIPGHYVTKILFFFLLGTIGAECACLPSCTEFKFAHSMTQGVLSNAKSLKFKSSLTEAIPDLTDDFFVRENIAIIHIYHENLHFLKHERGEVCLSGFRIYLFCQAYYL